MRHIAIIFLLSLSLNGLFSQCSPGDSIDIVPALIPAVPLPDGQFSFATGFTACDLNLNPIFFDSIFEAGEFVLLVGFSGTQDNIISLLPWFETVDSTYDLKHYLIYIPEAMPDTSCPDSICPYSQFTTCPGSTIFPYCQSQTIEQRKMSAERAVNGYNVNAVIDNEVNNFWQKYQNLPDAGYLIKGRYICKSWAHFNVSNFGGFVNACHLQTGIEEDMKKEHWGRAFDLQGLRAVEMTFKDWKGSDFPLFYSYLMREKVKR